MNRLLSKVLRRRTTNGKPFLRGQIMESSSSPAMVTHPYVAGGYHPVKLGDRFQDRYLVLRKLGFGKYSTVWLAQDESQKRFVALKILTDQATRHNDELRMLQRTMSVDPGYPGHSRIVQLLDHFQYTGPHGVHLCLVMEVLGPRLSDLQLFYRAQRRTIPSNIIKRVTKQVLLGLDYLHRKCDIVHTDLQPNNFLIELSDLTSSVDTILHESPQIAETIVLADGTEYGVIGCSEFPLEIPASSANWGLNVKIADLGMANFVDSPRTTLIQPPFLRAPEVVLGCKWNTKADIWSLGCIIFELLSGGIVLFRTDTTDDQSRELLKMMVNLFGNMPSEMIREGSLGKVYFNWRGRLRNEEIVPGGSSLQRILVRLKTLSDNREGVQVDLLPEDIDVVYDMLSRMLELSPVRRATAEELLKHEWLNGI